MTNARLPRRRALAALVPGLAGAMVLVIAGGMALMGSTQAEDAQATQNLCGTDHDALDAGEQTFLGHLRDWRADEGLVEADLEVSGALNAAAAWFAQHLVEEGATPPNAHEDAYGRGWAERAVDCGYPDDQIIYGSGEGMLYLEDNKPLAVPPRDAVYGGTAGPHEHSGVTYRTPTMSGAWLSRGGTLPAKCVGAAQYASSDGHKIAWVVVIARYPANEPCPDSNVSPPEPTETPTVPPATATSAATETPTTAPPEPTATSTPEPEPTTTATATPTPDPSPPGPGGEWRAVAPGLSVNVTN